VTVCKIVHTIAADKTKDVAVFEHDLGPDVIVQVRSEGGRVLKIRADVLPDRVVLHFRDGTTERLSVVIIG